MGHKPNSFGKGVQPDNPTDLNLMIAKYGLDHPASDPSGQVPDEVDFYRMIDAVQNGEKNRVRRFNFLFRSGLVQLAAEASGLKLEEVGAIFFKMYIESSLEGIEKENVIKELLNEKCEESVNGADLDFFRRMHKATDLSQEADGVFPHNCKSPGLALMANIKKVFEQFEMPQPTAQNCLMFFEFAGVEERDLRTIRALAKQVGMKLRAGNKGRPPKKSGKG